MSCSSKPAEEFIIVIKIDFDQRLSCSGIKHTHADTHAHAVVTVIASMYYRYTVRNKAIDISLITGIASLLGIHARRLRRPSCKSTVSASQLEEAKVSAVCVKLHTAVVFMIRALTPYRFRFIFVFVSVRFFC